MERNFALEYRMSQQRWDQVRENVREMEERARVAEYKKFTALCKPADRTPS